MGWIFDTCLDTVGSCIRQYTMFGISFIVFLLAAFSCFGLIRRQKKLPFELLPLSINTLTSLAIFIAYTQMQVFNIRIVLLIVELYSYFILTFGFVVMTLSQRYELKNRRFKKQKRIFVGISVLFLLAIVACLFLTATDIIDCNQDQGVTSIILIALEIPLFVIAFLFSRKSKALIRSNDRIDKTQYTHKTDHLINQQDQLKSVKINQINLVLYAFMVSFVLHFIQIYCYEVEDPQIICSASTNRIVINNQIQLYIFVIQNLSQLFPQFIIPIIFWYLPNKLFRSSQTLYMENDQFEDQFQSRDESHHSGRIKMSKDKSALDVRSEQQIRTKLYQNLSPKRDTHHLNRIDTI